MLFLIGFVVVSAQFSSAETINNSITMVTDPTGDNIGPVDLLAARAEIYERKIAGGPATQKLLKVTIRTTPNLPGAMIFECDVDDSTGTGGLSGQLGAPVDPCPCKINPGMDLALTIYHRAQGENSGSAFCGGCVDAGTNSCQKDRKGGEWYVVTAKAGQPLKALGFLRGYSDPTPSTTGGGTVQTSYTFPWQSIIAYANAELAGVPGRFNNDKARDFVTNNKWQLGIFYDGTNYGVDEDDITSGTFPNQTFDVCDWIPNGDGNDSPMLAADNLTYCEGNFDQDSDVDGGDAAAFKTNFGRSGFKNPCPDSNQYY